MALSLKKKQNKSELNLYYGMLYIKADRLGSSQGVKDAEAFFFNINFAYEYKLPPSPQRQDI